MQSDRRTSGGKGAVYQQGIRSLVSGRDRHFSFYRHFWNSSIQHHIKSSPSDVRESRSEEGEAEHYVPSVPSSSFAFTPIHTYLWLNYFSMCRAPILILFYRWRLGAIFFREFLSLYRKEFMRIQLRSSDITFVVVTLYAGHQNTFPGPVLYSFTSKNTVYFTNVVFYNTVPLTAYITR